MGIIRIEIGLRKGVMITQVSPEEIQGVSRLPNLHVQAGMSLNSFFGKIGYVNFVTGVRAIADKTNEHFGLIQCINYSVNLDFLLLLRRFFEEEIVRTQTKWNCLEIDIMNRMFCTIRPSEFNNAMAKIEWLGLCLVRPERLRLSFVPGTRVLVMQNNSVVGLTDELISTVLLTEAETGFGIEFHFNEELSRNYRNMISKFFVDFSF